MCNKTFIIIDVIDGSNSDSILITETWLTGKGSDVIITELTPSEFNLHSNPREGRTGGGICVSYTSFINIELENIEEFTSFQCTKVPVAEITIVCVYYPP